MKKKILLTMLLSATMAGCSKSNTSEFPTPEPSLDSYEPTTVPISFKTADNWGDTKAIPTVDDNFIEFGALAYYLPAGVETIDNIAPKFMYDQQVSYTGNAWGYEPMKYWPADGKIQFFGYHPYQSAETVLSSIDKVGYPTFTVSPHNKPYSQDDFIVASTEPLDNTTESVSMTFAHKLSQVKVYAAHCGKESATVTISNIAISGFRGTGTLVYDEAATGSDKYIWEHQKPDYNTPLETTATYNFNSMELDTSKALDYLSVATDDKDEYTDIDLKLGESLMMLIPENNIGELCFLITFIYSYQGTIVQSFQEMILQEGTNLIEGESTAYLLLIDPSNVTLGSVAVTSEVWIDKPITNGSSEDGSWELE